LWERLVKGSFEQAREFYERAIAIDDSYAPAFAGLAGLHALQYTFLTDPRELELAANYARRAILLDPHNGNAHVWLSYALWRNHRDAEAIEEADRASRFPASAHYGHYFAACTLLSQNRLAEALKRYQQAVDIDQSHGFAWLGLGWTHAELGHFAEAAWCLEKGIAHESSVGQRVTAGVDGYLGELLRRNGRLDEARLHCLKGVATAEASDHMYRDTFRAVGLCSLGRTALDQNDVEAARAAFTQVRLQIEGRPRALGGGHLLVQALAGLARCGDSRAWEEAIVLLNDRKGFNFSWFWLCTEDVTLNELGRAALALGREDEGRALLKRAAAAAAPRA
jgi:Tfp pilus assembly protein PilF